MPNKNNQLVIILCLLLLVAPVVHGEGRILVDMAGREVQLPDTIERIITTYRSATDFVFALKAQDYLVAIEMDVERIELFTTLLPGISDLPAVGSRRRGLNLEQMVAVSPDLVILFPFQEGLEMADRLEEQGIPSLIIDPESFEKIRETNLLLGEALNRREEALIVDKQFEEILKLVERSSTLPLHERKSVYFASSDLVNTVGAGMMQTSLIQKAGGINKAAEEKSGFMNISKEQLISWDPHVIILSQFHEEEINKIKELPYLQSLSSIKREAIYRIPSNIYPWDFPGPSSFAAILWLGEKLYPEMYQQLDLLEKVDSFYYHLYGKSFSQLGGEL